MPLSADTSVTPLKLSSPAFEHNTEIPVQYTQFGDDISPEFSIENVDVAAKSLVFIMEDPDTPNGLLVHWVKYNIPPETTVFEEGKEPEGVAGSSSKNTLTYFGPKPPSGTHRYFFKLYALDVMLDADEGLTKDQLENLMAGHIIQHTELIGRFTKPE